MAFLRVARTWEIPEGRAGKFQVGDEEIALWHIGGRFFAIANRCPHEHFALLHQGTLDGLAVTCPMHGWTFDLVSGQALKGDGRVRTYAVKVEGSDVLVEPSS